MGRPLRKLHQIHLSISVQPGYQQDPRRDSFTHPFSLPNRLEVQALVSKNNPSGKADRQTISSSHGLIGNIIQYSPICGGEEPLDPHLFVISP
jgi:hypothetical protein